MIGKQRRRSRVIPCIDRRLPVLLVSLALAPACSRRRSPPASADLPAVVSTDVGPMEVEAVYLPGVVDCELGWFTAQAPALAAQAIAARTYLARFLLEHGAGARVPIGPHFQCWRPAAHARSRAAAAATAGVVLRHRGEIIFANYVSGADLLDARCAPPIPLVFGYPHLTWEALARAVARGARFRGYAWTEAYVTHNPGRRGAAVRQTPQNAPLPPNRGAFGQYAAACLAERRGYDTAAILRHFYGADVVIGRRPKRPATPDDS